MEYTAHIRVEDIPWNRLISSYGWAAEFPSLLSRLDSPDISEAADAAGSLESEMEHQGTLWPCTPFALVFMCRWLEKAMAGQPDEKIRPVVDRVLEVFNVIAEACDYAFSMEHAEALPEFADMLDEKYLLPGELRNSEDVYLCVEDGFDIPDDLFFSVYYYSFVLLKSVAPLCARAGAPELEKKILLLGETLG